MRRMSLQAVAPTLLNRAEVTFYYETLTILVFDFVSQVCQLSLIELPDG